MDAINQNRAAKQALTTFKKKTLKSAQTTTANKIVVYENLNVLVDDSEAKYMEKIDGTYHSYTFKALDMNATDQKKNLVLSLKDDGSYRVVLLNYYLTPNDLASYTTTGALDLDTKANLTVVDSNTYTIDVYSKNVAPTTSGGGPDCLVPDITPGSTCTAPGNQNHEFGETCIGTPDQQPTPDVFNGFTLDWDCIDTHMGSGGGPNNPGPSGSPGGKPSNTNPNGGSDNDNDPDDEFATASDLEEMVWEDDPCENLKNQTNTADYKQKFKDLNTTENFNLPDESGFYEIEVNGQNEYVDGVANANHMVVIPNESLNATHVHNNKPSVRPDNTAYDGAVKIPSPVDLSRLLTRIHNANNPTPQNGFVVSVSDEGIYAISITAPITSSEKTLITGKWIKFREEYDVRSNYIIQNFTTPQSRKDNLELMFLKELKTLGLDNKIAFFEGEVENENDPDISNYNIAWTKKSLGRGLFGANVDETPCN